MGQVIIPPPYDYRNLMANSLVKFNQPGTTANTNYANGSTSWTNADMFFVKNSLGTTGVAKIGIGALNIFTNVINASVGTAPTALQANGLEIYHFVDDVATLSLMNAGQASETHATLTFFAQPNGNTTQIGVQPFYSTVLNTKPATSFGTELVFSIAGGGAVTTCSGVFDMLTAINNSAVTLAFRIRQIAVSSGNLYDINNGFAYGYAMLNRGSIAAPWQPYGGAVDLDLLACKRWFQKSYDLTVTTGTSTNAGAIWYCTGKQPDAGGDNQRATVTFPVEFAQTPAAMASASSNYWDMNGSAARQSTIIADGTLTNGQNLSTTYVLGKKSMYVATVVPQNATSLGYHYALDARPTA